ncbi:Elicitor peptide [Arabidopsis thaliana x Arabidopsis arenosa]|uniref:Elicitor peptide n=1 Tax=Arabidopsis thaliana x Arabidopsis arenosa TaxID=1240361 RepID=A0A8T2A470_9BRAS|nr:Elicitor peptide [Arabidopsis thaliana x Arabidopsis arenosa]
MEVKGEEERRSRREDEEKEDYYSLLNSPCSACHKVVQAILKCLGLESSSIPPPSSSSSSSSSPSLVEEEEDPGTETVEETGFMARIAGVLRRRPRPPYSSGRPGQNN